LSGSCDAEKNDQKKDNRCGYDMAEKAGNVTGAFHDE